MRFWHESLLHKLDRARLLGLHREVCGARGLGWGRKHSVVDYAWRHPRAWLVAYHGKVIMAMHARGYHVDPAWFGTAYRGKRAPRDEGVDGAEFMAALCRYPTYPEHDAARLIEETELLRVKQGQ